MLGRLGARIVAKKLLFRGPLCRPFSDSMARLDRLIEKLEKSTGVSPAASMKASDKAQDKPASLEEMRNCAFDAAKQEESTKKKTAGSKQPAKEPEALNAMQLFLLSEIRVGELSEVAELQGSEKLYSERVDIGTQQRSVASGLRPYIPIEGMTGKVLLFANLKPRKLAGHLSEGMLLCSSVCSPDGKVQIELCRPSDASQVGERVFPEGFEQETQQGDLPVMKSDHVARVIEQLSTDSAGCIIYSGVRLRKPTDVYV